MVGATAQKKLLQLQTEVETDEEWTGTVLTQPALSVVDVWPHWAGPCVAMRSKLIRFKLTEGGDNVHLFSANASTIEALSRFREHSEPAWLLFGSGHLVCVYIGCNCPHLLRLVEREMLKEQRVLRGEVKRRVLSMDKTSPAEKQRQDVQQAKDTLARQEEQDRNDAAWREIRMRQYRRLADELPNHTVVLFLPHALEQGQLPEVALPLLDAWRAMGVHVLQSRRVTVTRDMADELFWERRLPQHAALVESLQAAAGLCVALLLRKGQPPAEVDEDAEDEDAGGQGDAPRMTGGEDDEDEDLMRQGLLERLVAETVYGFYPGSASTSARNDSLSEFFSPVGGGSPGGPSLGGSPLGDNLPAGTPGTPLPQTSPPLQTSPLLSAMSTASAGQYRRSTASWVRQSTLNLGPDHDDPEGPEEWDDHDEYEGSPSYGSQSWPKELRPVMDSVAAALLRRVSSLKTSFVLPGVWTPLTALSKAAGLRVLFGSLAMQHYEPEELPPSPAPVIVISFKANKRTQVLEAASNFLRDIVYLGFFTGDRKLLAESPAEYDALAYKEPRDRLVLGLSQRSEEPLLELASFGPLYLSPTARLAAKDVEEHFTGNVQRAPPRLDGHGEVDAEGETEGLFMYSRIQQAARVQAGARPPEPPQRAGTSPGQAVQPPPPVGTPGPRPAEVTPPRPEPRLSGTRVSAHDGPGGGGLGSRRPSAGGLGPGRRDSSASLQLPTVPEHPEHLLSEPHEPHVELKTSPSTTSVTRRRSLHSLASRSVHNRASGSVHSQESKQSVHSLASLASRASKISVVRLPSGSGKDTPSRPSSRGLSRTLVTASRHSEEKVAFPPDAREDGDSERFESAQQGSDREEASDTTLVPDAVAR